MSAAPDWARSLPQAWPDAERLLRLDPDLTVFGAGEAGRVGAMLDRAGMDWVELAWASDFDGVRTNLRTVGASLDRAAAVEGVLGDMDRRLEALQDRAGQRSGQPRILYLSSSGGSAGSGTYVDAAIRAAGGINVTAEQGGIGWTRSDPEFALTMDADILLTSFSATVMRARSTGRSITRPTGTCWRSGRGWIFRAGTGPAPDRAWLTPQNALPMRSTSGRRRDETV